MLDKLQEYPYYISINHKLDAEIICQLLAFLVFHHLFTCWNSDFGGGSISSDMF